MTRQHASMCALAALVCVASGVHCGEDVVDCEIDQVFTQPQQTEIQRAGRTWNALTTRAITFSPDGEWLILPASVPLGLGLEQKHRRLIRISPETPDDQIYAVALHELGHALGLQHTAKGVMHATRQAIVFSAEDVAECRRAGACR